MKKRLIVAVLTFSLLLVSLTSCLRVKDSFQLPPDFVDGDGIVIDNETPFVYVEPTDNEDIEYLLFWNFDELTYRDFIQFYGNKIVRCYESPNDGIQYYTVFSLPNYRLCYLFLIPTDNGDFLMDYCSYLDSRTRDEGRLFYPQDSPEVILDGKMPDYCYKEHYSFDEIENKIESKWDIYANFCYEADLESHISFMYAKDEEGNYKTTGFYRVIQDMSFDVLKIEDGREIAYYGTYVYDICFLSDGSGTLHYRHYIFETFPKLTLDQEETVILSPEDVSRLQETIEINNFYEIPTWNPEEFLGSDGESTYILGFDASQYWNPHLAAMWGAAPRYGIYQIRTAVETLVRERIEVTSGCVYVEYDIAR